MIHQSPMVIFARLENSDARFSFVIDQEALVQNIDRAVRVVFFVSVVFFVERKEQSHIGRIGPIEERRHQAMVLAHRPQLVIFVHQRSVVQPPTHRPFESVQLALGKQLGDDAIGRHPAQRGHQTPIVTAVPTEHQLYPMTIEKIALQQIRKVTPAFKASYRDATTQVISHDLKALGVAISIPEWNFFEVVA